MNYDEVPMEKSDKGKRWGVDVNGIHIHCFSIGRRLYSGVYTLILYDDRGYIIAKVNENDVSQIRCCKTDYQEVSGTQYLRDHTVPNWQKKESD